MYNRQATISDLLDEARRELQSGMQLSKQGAYARRTPDSQARQHLLHARDILVQAMKIDARDPEVLNLLSRVEECFLNYAEAIHYLEAAFASGKSKSKKDLKRLALLREHLVEWRDLILTPTQLSELGEYLMSKGINQHSQNYTYTREWLLINGFDEIESVISSLKRRGAFTDYQVLENIVRG